MTSNQTQDRDQFFMARCLELSKKGLGYTFPNPMVGAVIVYNDTIIGEGWHHAAGSPHAEINALKQVKDKNLLKKSTIYVSLEPCCHFGKTPPCADAILTHKIPRIVVAIKDPHNKVAGKGIEKLRAAGCEVIVNVLEKEALELNKRFICFHQKKRPYIILKWAESCDGFIAPRNQNKGTIHWITGTFSRQLVHQWRSEEDAILVGVQTVNVDNPSLTTRDWVGQHPKRFVVDPNSRILHTATLLTDQYSTTVFSKEKQTFTNSAKKTTVLKEINVNTIIEKLYLEQIQSVFIEGGKKTLQSFLDAGLWDEARVFKGPKSLKSGIQAPLVNANPKSTLNINQDQLLFYYSTFQKHQLGL